MLNESRKISCRHESWWLKEHKLPGVLVALCKVIQMVLFFLVCLCAMCVPASFLIPCYQMGLWLKDGFWTPLSTKVLFTRILPDELYVLLGDDTSWVGLKKIISYIIADMPLFLFVFLFGLLFVWFLVELADIFEIKTVNTNFQTTYKINEKKQQNQKLSV